MNRYKGSSIKKNFIYSSFFQVLSLITPFITAPYVSRVLGADGIGIQSYTASYQTYFSLFAALGTATYGAREISRARNDEHQRSILFWEIELLTIVTSSVSMAGWMFFILCVKEYQIYYIVLSLNILAVMFDISWFFSGIERFDLIVVRNTVFKLAGIVCIFVFIKAEDDLLLYIMILAFTTLLSNISIWPLVKKYTVKVKIKDIKIRRHLKETIIYFIPTIAASVYVVLDKTLIGLITHDTAENGYYQQADKVIGMAKSLVFTAINSVVGVRISYLFKEDCMDEIRQRIENSIHFILLMGIGCMFGIMGVAENFVPVFFGKGYNNVIFLLYIMSPIIVIVGISNCLGSHYYTPSGRRIESTKYIIAGSFINLILNLILIPTFRSCGAAAASIMAELVIPILYVRHSSRFVTVSMLLRFGWKKFAAGSIMFGVVLLIGKSGLVSFVKLLIQVVCGIGVYVTLLVVFRDKWSVSVIKSAVSRIVRTKKMKSKRTGWIISCILLAMFLIAGVVGIKKLDGIYNRMSRIKSSFTENREYKERHRQLADLSELEPLTANEEGKWYQSYHFISHSGGGIEGRVYTNSREAWELSYENGNRVFDADLAFTSDGILVLRHEWSDNLETGGIAISQSSRSSDLNGSERIIVQQNVPDFETFYNTKIFYKYTPMSCEDMLKFMDTHKDLYVSCDVKGDYTQAYQFLVDLAGELNAKESLERIIVNFYKYEDYEVINNVYPFENYVFRQHFGREHNYYEMIEFCVKNHISVVNISACYVYDEGVQLMQEYGIHPVVAVCDYISDMHMYEEIGIHHAVSNWLSEKDWKLIEK